MANPVILISIAGFLISAYSLYVKFRSKSKDYKPLCDIRDNISCTKAFSSDYGRMLLVPNSLIGLFFYPFVIALSLNGMWNYVFYLAVMSFIVSLYLAYISYFRMKNFCLVCSGIYAVSLLLVVFGYISL